MVSGGAGCGSAGPSTRGSGGAGGQSGTGGNPATGGATTGASATGGNATGGAITGSSATGGNVTAGAGGDAVGGNASGGGNPGLGGSAASGGTGGRTSATGGSNATGVATGGTIARGGGGGAASSGSGGSNAAGGTASGGSATGGTAGNATGGVASGGVTGSGGTTGNPTGGTGGGGPFVLAWQDDFDTLDTSLWQAQSFTWDGNQAQFTPQNVSVASGKLTISLTNAPSGSAKPYLGVELRSTKTLTYGKVSASMRFAKGSGVVSGLVLFYTPYPNCDWNEIDIEHLGNSSTTSQLNCQIYAGTPVSNCTTSVSPTQDPQVVNLGVDAETAFHQYDIEWTPVGVKFLVDGTLLRTWTANISRLKLPQNILLTIWASNSASWAGPLNTSSAPTSAEVDWIKVYSWNG
jgi:hypothetical protein